MRRGAYRLDMGAGDGSAHSRHDFAEMQVIGEGEADTMKDMIVLYGADGVPLACFLHRASRSR